nr:hypothetical protein [Escherichia coli]
MTKVGHLTGDELHWFCRSFRRPPACCPLFQGVWQITQQATEIGVILHHGAQGGFADVAALEELLHEADGGFLVALEVGFDLQGGVAGVHAIQFGLDGAELAQHSPLSLSISANSTSRMLLCWVSLLGQRLQHLFRLGLRCC